MAKKHKGKAHHGMDGQSMQAGTHMSFTGSKAGHGKPSQMKGSHTPKGGGKASSYHMGKNESHC